MGNISTAVFIPVNRGLHMYGALFLGDRKAPPPPGELDCISRCFSHLYSSRRTYVIW